MNFSSPHHSFDVNLASQHSIEEAILIHHFQHWIMVNYRQGAAKHDGLFWTYQTLEWMQAHFPYWSVDQIRTIIKKLVQKGLLKKGNFNKLGFDRTVWYALTDQSFLDSQMHMVKLPNGCGETTTPIPDTKDIYLKKERVSDTDVLVFQFLEMIKKYKPDFIKTPTKNWHENIQALLKVRTPEQIFKVLEWALKDSFWKANVQSPNGLYNNLDKIETKMASKPSQEDTKTLIARHKEQALAHEMSEGLVRIDALNDHVELIRGSICKVVKYDVCQAEWEAQTGW